MIRTQIYLPEDLHSELMLLARAEGVKYSHLIREGVKEVVQKKIKRKGNFDPWRDFVGKGKTGGPKDLSSNLDYYLYVEPYEKKVKK